MSEPTIVQSVYHGLLGAFRLSDGTSRAETDEECSKRTGLPLIDGLMVIREGRQAKSKPACIECCESNEVFAPMIEYRYYE